MNKKRDMKIACPGIILYDYPQKLLNHQQINSVILSSVTGFYSEKKADHYFFIIFVFRIHL